MLPPFKIGAEEKRSRPGYYDGGGTHRSRVGRESWEKKKSIKGKRLLQGLDWWGRSEEERGERLVKVGFEDSGEGKKKIMEITHPCKG